MAIVYPDFQTISKLRTPATEGEFFLLNELSAKLSSDFEIFFNPFLDGDRPDIIILRKGYGAVVIEVKDWNLDLYRVDESNRWKVRTNSDSWLPIKSPMAQAFHYKKNIFDLHIPVLGVNNAINNNFFKTVMALVYFHESNKHEISYLYEKALENLKRARMEANHAYHDMSHGQYENKINKIDDNIKKLERDKRMSFSRDMIGALIKKISNISASKIFSEEIYKEFKRRLSPSEWFFQQGKPLILDEKQERLAQSRDERIKIRGVAGCGKTSILAKRAINAYFRHESVLILTFNNTLKNLIRDRISHINHYSFDTKCDTHRMEISNYHQFFIDQLNNIGIELENDELIEDSTYLNRNLFINEKTIRYKTIFLDEVQDYEKGWIYIIRDFFLEEGGEMVLFGDRAQNIYDRELAKEKDSDDEKSTKMRFTRLNGFGSRWEDLKKTYRSKLSPLTNLFRDYQETFLAKKYDTLNMFDRMRQGVLSTEFLAFSSESSHDLPYIAQCIDMLIKKKGFVPNDTTIIAGRKETLCELEDFFHKQEKTMTTFPTSRELAAIENSKFVDRDKKELSKKKLDQLKKYAFQMNSGLLKFATVHSFKGMESRTVFYILDPNDTEELVYTAITRAKENLIIYDLGNETMSEFFAKKMETLPVEKKGSVSSRRMPPPGRPTTTPTPHHDVFGDEPETPYESAYGRPNGFGMYQWEIDEGVGFRD